MCEQASHTCLLWRICFQIVLLNLSRASFRLGIHAHREERKEKKKKNEEKNEKNNNKKKQEKTTTAHRNTLTISFSITPNLYTLKQYYAF